MHGGAAAAALAFVVGCGGAQRAKPAQEGPACALVSRHLIELALADNEATQSPDELTGVEATFERQCKEEPWSRERRECLLGAKTQEDTLRCPER